MKYQDIHAALVRQGMNWRIAAEAIGCTPHHLMNICARRTMSQKTAKSLALILQLEVSAVFPDIPRYSAPSPKTLRAKRVAEARERIAAGQ